MTNDEARDPAASLGSHGPAAWWFKCDDYESVTLFKEHADAMAAPYGTKPIPLYRQPQPALTDEERKAVDFFAAVTAPHYGERFSRHAAVLRALLERTK